jgi:RNA methyltransferase, TrmH family
MLSSRQNPLVKTLRQLHRPKGRQELGLLLFEGSHLLEEAAATDYPLDTLCYTAHWRDQHPELFAQLCGQSDRAIEVSPEVLAAIATTESPDGILASARRQILRSPQFPCDLGLAVETLQDPGNLGTLIRTATAVGVQGLWLSNDSVGLDNPKVLRSSAGQWFRMPMTTSPNLADSLRAAQASGMQVIATEVSATVPYWDVDLRSPTLILLGNEGAGLSAELAAIADHRVQIPLAPGVESLNVAISASVILYEAKRQRSRS